MSIKEIYTPGITAAQLAELLKISDEYEDGPAALLAELVEYAIREETESGTMEEALQFIATEGLNWPGAKLGHIGLNVRIFNQQSDEIYCKWTSDGDSTWTTLGEVVDAIKNGNKVPNWFDKDWFTVQVMPSVWVTQAQLRDENDNNNNYYH